MANKRFQEADYRYGIEGETFVAAWLSKLGYDVELPTSKYGPDLYLNIPSLGRIPVEVETRKPSSWPTGMFPFDTYNLPERRYAKALKSLLIVLNADMSRALLVYPSSVFDAMQFNEFQMKTNTYAKNERILEIPVDLCRDVSTNTKDLKIGRKEEW